MEKNNSFYSIIAFTLSAGLGLSVSLNGAGYADQANADLSMSFPRTASSKASAIFESSSSSVTNLSLSSEQIHQIESQLPRLQEDKTFYHWTKSEVGMRWVQQGHINAGEMDFYNTSTGVRQVYGPGLYLADNPTSSAQFGIFPVAFVIKKGTLLFDQAIVAKILQRQPTLDEITVLGKIIPFVRDLKINQGWFITNSSLNTQDVRYAGPVGAKIDPLRLGSFSELVPLYESATSNGGGNAYLENLFFLTKYLDGISFMAAMESHPDHPENVFEPDNFERFK